MIFFKSGFNLLVSLGFIFVFVLNFADINNEHNWGDDFSGYIVQAKYFVKGKINVLEEASQKRVSLSETQVGPNFYPWGYPLILAIPYAIFGINFFIFKIITFLFFIGSVFLFYFLIKGKISPKLDVLLVLLFFSSPFFFVFKQNVLSDVPAMFFSLLSLFLIQIIYFNSEEKPNKIIRDFIFLGLAIFSSIFIRTASIVLVGTLFFIQVFNFKSLLKKKNGIFHLIPYVVIAICYILSNLFFPVSSYLNNHTFLSSSTLNEININIKYYSTVLFDFFGDSTGMVYFITVPFFAIGLIIGWKKNYLFLVYFLLNLALFLVYPYRQGLRFIISLVPIYLFFFGKGLEAIYLKNFSEINWRKISYGFLIFLFLYFLKQDFYQFGKSRFIDGCYAKTSKELFSFVKKQTKKNDVFSFFKPRAFFLFTQKEAVRIDSPKFLEDNKDKINYYVFSKSYDSVEMVNFLNSSGYSVVFSNNDFIVYRIK